MKIYINKSQYGYSTTAKDKDKQLKIYIDVQFKKGQEPTTDQIQLNNAFFSCYQAKDGIKPKIVVMDYLDIGNDFEERTKEEPKTSYTTNELMEDAYKDFGKDIVVEEEDLAF